MDIKGVNFVSLNDVKPALSNAILQVALEKKWVKPIVNATKFGKSLKCSTIITLPFGLQTLRHSFKNRTFSSCLRISCIADIKKYCQQSCHLMGLSLNLFVAYYDKLNSPFLLLL